MSANAFRRAHYIFIAEGIRRVVPLGAQRNTAVQQMLAILSPIPGFKESRFLQACYADDPSHSSAANARATRAPQRRRMDRVDSGQS